MANLALDIRESGSITDSAGVITTISQFKMDSQFPGGLKTSTTDINYGRISPDLL